ncbi:MAG TPA: hypothetical protein PLM20_07485 [Syntrophomonadaceae bacterium]|nr:hypothetical protein [Syntrophomonadaceae bacterium]HQE23724.1 hypothetical protein [Syntrophomonadaceae bacterium]
MTLKLAGKTEFQPGDLVTVNNLPQHWRFCVIGIKNNEHNEPLAILKALFNDTFIIEKPCSELKSLLIKGLL